MGCPKLTYHPEFLHLVKETAIEKSDHVNFLPLDEKNAGKEKNDNYYAFGLTFNTYQRENNPANDFKYNGKEMQDEFALNWLDYGARMYMSEIGRWGVVDPMAEKYTGVTPYNYCFNTPMILTDPNGKDPLTGQAAISAFFNLQVQSALNGWGLNDKPEQSKNDKSSSDNLNSGKEVENNSDGEVTENQFLEFLNFFWGHEAAQVKKSARLNWEIGGRLIDDADGQIDRNKDGSIVIKISQKALMDPKLLYLTIGHELIHAADFVNGNHDKWVRAVDGDMWTGDDRKELISAIGEYHAFLWEVQAEIDSGWDYGAQTQLKGYTSYLKDASDMTGTNYIGLIKK